MSRRLILSALVFVAFTAGQVRAGSFTVTYRGVQESGTFLPAGTAYTIQVVSSDTPIPMGTGEAEYSVISITASFNYESMPYTVTSENPSDYDILLTDPTSAVGDYVVGLESSGFEYGALLPGFATATPPISALDPATTEFSGYLGSVLNIAQVELVTDLGTVTFNYNYNRHHGIDVSMLVPEPTSLELALAAVIAGGGTGLACRRRRAGGKP